MSSATNDGTNVLICTILHATAFSFRMGYNSRHDGSITDIFFLKTGKQFVHRRRGFEKAGKKVAKYLEKVIGGKETEAAPPFCFWI